MMLLIYAAAFRLKYIWIKQPSYKKPWFHSITEAKSKTMENFKKKHDHFTHHNTSYFFTSSPKRNNQKIISHLEALQRDCPFQEETNNAKDDCVVKRMVHSENIKRFKLFKKRKLQMINYQPLNWNVKPLKLPLISFSRHVDDTKHGNTHPRWIVYKNWHHCWRMTSFTWFSTEVSEPRKALKAHPPRFYVFFVLLFLFSDCALVRWKMKLSVDTFEFEHQSRSKLP